MARAGPGRRRPRDRRRRALRRAGTAGRARRRQRGAVVRRVRGRAARPSTSRPIAARCSRPTRWAASGWARPRRSPVRSATAGSGRAAGRRAGALRRRRLAVPDGDRGQPDDHDHGPRPAGRPDGRRRGTTRRAEPPDGRGRASGRRRAASRGRRRRGPRSSLGARRIRLRARMISATPATITPPATSWIAPTASWRRSQPRNTAIDRVDEGVRRRRAAAARGGCTQTKAVNAIRLPTTVRYADRRGGRPRDGLRRNAASSPETTAATREHDRAAANIWRPVARNGSVGRRHRVRRRVEPGGPRHRRDDERGDPERIEAPVAPSPRADEDRRPRPCRATIPTTAESRQALAEEDPAEDRDPDRHHRDQDAGDPRRDGLLAHDDEAHPAAHQAGPDDRSSRAARAGVGRTATAPRAAIAPRRSARRPRSTNRTAPMTNGGMVSTATRIAR